MDERECNELLGCAVVLEACAKVLADRPDVESVAELQRVASRMGASVPEAGAIVREIDDGLDLASLEGRFDQRFLVAGSSLYVPLSENCVRLRRTEGGRVSYGPVEGAYSAHVVACYEAAGFDWRQALGEGLLARVAPPDSLAAELLFAAWLARGGAEAAAAGDELRARHMEALGRQFCEQHLSRWAADASELLAATGEDFFSQVAALAARTTEALAEGPIC